MEFFLAPVFFLQKDFEKLDIFQILILILQLISYTKFELFLAALKNIFFRPLEILSKDFTPIKILLQVVKR